MVHRRVQKTCERQATLTKFKINTVSENIKKYKQQWAKTRRIIKEAKRSSRITFTLKINSKTNIPQNLGLKHTTNKTSTTQ